LIDAPAASKLGENRALYFSEEENRIEKFRPYGLPEHEWLEGVKQRFGARPLPQIEVAVKGNGEASRSDGEAAVNDEAALASSAGPSADGNGPGALGEPRAPSTPLAGEVSDPRN
jgi:DNA segregation ATPase FtsK/SpoIIIE, S-DNA-T family